MTTGTVLTTPTSNSAQPPGEKHVQLHPGAMNDQSCIEQRKAERTAQRLRYLCWTQTLIIVVIGVSVTLSHGVEAQSSPRVLRADGTVIEDDQGRARLILGAPLPEVHERKRFGSLTDSIVFFDEQGNYSVQWPCGAFPRSAIPDLDAGGNCTRCVFYLENRNSQG
jgi:hypothetical protein